MIEKTVASKDPESDDFPAESAEQCLLLRARQGDRAAFRQIVEDNKVRMYQVACSVLINSEAAEDVVQEAFIKAYQGLPKFRMDASITTWLHRITFLTAIDHRRREKNNMLNVIDMNQTEQVEDSQWRLQTELAMEAVGIRRELNRAIKMLTPLERSIFTLRHMQSFKIREIALIVERSEGTVKNILFRSVRKLRRQLQGLENHISNEAATEMGSC